MGQKHRKQPPTAVATVTIDFDAAMRATGLSKAAIIQIQDGARNVSGMRPNEVIAAKAKLAGLGIATGTGKQALNITR